MPRLNESLIRESAAGFFNFNPAYSFLCSLTVSAYSTRLLCFSLVVSLVLYRGVRLPVSFVFTLIMELADFSYRRDPESAASAVYESPFFNKTVSEISWTLEHVKVVKKEKYLLRQTDGTLKAG